MIQFYPQIKGIHVLMVLLSGSLFAVRGAGVLLGWRWPMSWPVRGTSYVIDTTLLTAALMLLTILPWGLFSNGWLVMKLGLLVVYISFATLALRGRTARRRAMFYVLALLVFGWMFSIARAHHPLGLLSRLLEPGAA